MSASVVFPTPAAGSIGWVWLDPRQYEAAEEARALLATPGARDELGLGGIRDRFADAMFPGTSTIQTRLRYALLVSDAYDRLIDRPGAELAREGRAEEIATIDRLLLGEADRGVIGARAGGTLVRLPSMSYWTLLREWRAERDFPSRSQWLALPPDKRRARPLLPTRSPPAPRASETFELSAEERRTLRGRLEVRPGPRTLFHNLVDGRATIRGTAAEEAELEHIRVPDLRNATILRHALAFSRLLWGASLAYNILLLRERIRWRDGGIGGTDAEGHEKDDKHLADRLGDWREWLEHDRAVDARLVLSPGFFDVVGAQGENATHFARDWALAAPGMTEPEHACRLVEGRERHVKPEVRQRFRTRRALARWGGASDIAAADYRWKTARQFLIDLGAEGLRPDAGSGE